MLPKTMVEQNGVICAPAKGIPHVQMITGNQIVNYCRKGIGYCSKLKTKVSTKGLSPLYRSVSTSSGSWISSFMPQSTETDYAETKDKHCNDGSNYSSSQMEDRHANELENSTPLIHGIAQACRYVHNDAEFMNQKARNDIILLSRGLEKLNARAQQDVSLLGSEFLKLDARAREDTERIDLDVKKKAESIHHVATLLKRKAQTSIKTAADKHWSDGALEADLKRADSAARRRAIADSLMALEFVKSIHDMTLCKMKRNSADKSRHITVEKNGIIHELISGDASVDRITALQEAYWSIASALSEVDGIDYTDPEELELLVATLIDLDAMDGKSSVSLLAECSSSPDVSTRRALANALSAAPSMWKLGNAGMGALQRLVEDTNPAIAEAASKTIKELKKQWEIEEGDSWRFMMDSDNELKDE